MMRSSRLMAWLAGWLAVFMAFVAAGLWVSPAPVAAQDFVPVTVFKAQSSDHGETLGLDVFFVLRDSAGRPVPDADISGAALSVLNDPNAQATLQSVAEADSPLYVAMLLDTSGSMKGALPSVLDAAQRAIDMAPDNAQLGITRFSDAASLVQRYSSDRGEVRAALGRIADPGGNTCLYDTIYAALDDLASAAPGGATGARKVVIVFTDGQDLRILDNGNFAQCSRRSFAEVVQRAKELQIAVNTIGMYAQPDDINSGELTQLAKDTGGFSAIGANAGVGDLFRTIFSGLNSHYRAAFELLVGAGEKRGVLEVRLASGESLYSAPFRFVSPREFAAPVAPAPEPTPEPTPVPLPAAQAQINGIRFNAERNQYDVGVSVADPAPIYRLVFTVEGDNGQIAYEAPFNLNGEDTIMIPIDAGLLVSGREYTAMIQAVDAGGKCIPRPPDPNRFDQSPDCLLAQKVFKHEPPPPPPVEFIILPVVADAESGVIQIPLRITREEMVEQFSGTIVDAATGQEIGQFGPDVYEAGEPLVVAMPPSMLTPSTDADGQARRYLASVVLKTKDDQTVTAEPYAFVVNYPPPVPWHEQVFAVLEQNPLLLGSIALIVLLLSLYFVYGNRKERPAFRLAGGGAEYTVIGEPAAAAAAERRAVLAIKVGQTPQPTDRRSYTIREFPCTIGRSTSCSIRFAGDRQISRTHVSIALEDGEFRVSDLGSDNGTWLDGKRLAPHMATKLRDIQTLRLGPNTTLEIRIQY